MPDDSGIFFLFCISYGLFFRDVEAPSPTVVSILCRLFLKNASIFKSSLGRRPLRIFLFRDVEAPSPTIVKQLAAILTALAFHFGEGGPLAVEEV